MPTLTQAQLLQLAGYARRPRERNGYTVPGTDNRRWHEVGCWAWALRGDITHAGHPTSASNVYDRIIENDYQNNDYATGIANVDHQFLGSAADFTALRTNRLLARAGDRAAQDAFVSAMVRIAARANGLTPQAGRSIYTLHMRTSRWYGWDHWGIGIRLPNNNVRTYVQTTPELGNAQRGIRPQPLAHTCETMWDEGLDYHAIVYLQELLPAHISMLAAIKLGPCVQCPHNHFHGWFTSRINFWQRCLTCGAVHCSNHSAQLATMGPRDPARRCSRCNNRCERKDSL